MGTNQRGREALSGVSREIGCKSRIVSTVKPVFHSNRIIGSVAYSIVFISLVLRECSRNNEIQKYQGLATIRLNWKTSFTLCSSKASKNFTLLKLYRNSRSFLTETPSFTCLVHHSCSQTTSVICFSAHKQLLNCSIRAVYTSENKPRLK